MKKNRAELENGLRKFWEENQIFEKSIEQRPNNKRYVFFDGPPFATGLPHYGHILGLTSKDLFPRYWTMKGYKVNRTWGWDCHGLPIENLAEKELGIKRKNEIQEYGVAKFNKYCESKVLHFANEWKKTVSRLGMWTDFDNSYKTMDNSFMESVWHIFKTLYEKKLAYEGKKILLYCPRCETPIANAEIAMDNSYKTVTEDSAIAKFKLKDEKDTYILAWTTTPWTLIGNITLAVNKKNEYVKVKKRNDYLICSKEYYETIKDEVSFEKKIKGKKLIGKEYEPLYEHEIEKPAWKIIDGGKEIVSDEGTGIVHMAIYGELDYKLIKKYDFEQIQHVGNNGLIIKGPKKFIGQWFKKTDKIVLEDLKERKLLFKSEPYTHNYPFCYRCETPLFYNAVNSWFFNIQKIKNKMLKEGKKIKWHPKKIEKRFEDIMKTAPDWTISRNRFWATAIPVWKCECKKMKIIGSIKELQKESINQIEPTIDLHKHSVDEVKLNCGCGKEMTRVPEVFDCWLESGSMPYASIHYPFKNKELFNKTFPGDFISEYIGQVRAWFYYMHTVGVLFKNKAPVKNIITSGNILASDGTKMSKSKKNYPDPNLIFDKYGADSLRFYLMNSVLMKANDLNFKEEGLVEVYKKVIVILTNVKNFHELFANKNINFKPSTKHILDEWIVSKLNQLIKNNTESLDDYDTSKTCYDLIKFINELSTWYVRRSRERFKGTDEKDKNNALNTLSYVLIILSKLMAPITPFVSEEIYQGLKIYSNKLSESVHLSEWPSYDKKLIKTKLNEDMDLIKELVSKGLKKRDEIKVAVKQPLNAKELIVPERIHLNKDYLQIIKEELNLKKIHKIGLAKIILTNDEGRKLRKENIIDKYHGLDIVLDPKISKDLRVEGIKRELVRSLNHLRKKKSLTINQRINLKFQTTDELVLESLEKFKEELMYSTQADKIEIVESLKTGSDVFKINESKVNVFLKVLG